MRVGERSHVWVSSEYGYGQRGNFSFPTIPPHTNLVYDLELVQYEPPREGKSSGDMMYEERLEAAKRRRNEGNEAFKQGNYQEALAKYSLALSFVDEDLMIQLQGFHYDQASAERIPALLNVAACHLKQENYQAAIAAASQVLAEDPGNGKARFRRGVAKRALGQTEAAIEDLMAARKAAPGDGAISRELTLAKRELLDEKMASAGLFKGLIDRAGGEGGGLGLYSDDEVVDDGGDVGIWDVDGVEDAMAAGGGGKNNKGWVAFIMEALCPFAFARRKID